VLGVRELNHGRGECRATIIAAARKIMNRTSIRLLPALVGAALLSACDPSSTSPGEPSFFLASLDGAVEQTFQGTGDFADLREETDQPRRFVLFSRTTVPGRRDNIYLIWPQAGRPRPGTYALVPHSTERGNSAGIVAMYLNAHGNNVDVQAVDELYVALGGQVTITRSSADVVEGSVVIDGAQVYREVGIDIQRQDSRAHPDPAAPRVQVNGSFRAVFYDESAEVGYPD
jgi:hypothetical protein